MDIKAVLARAVAELEEAEAQYRAAQKRVRELEAIRDGLQLAMDRYETSRPGDQGESTDADRAANPDGSRLGGLTAARESLPGIPDRPKRGQVISHVALANAALTALVGPRGTVEIRDRISRAGHSLKTDQVRAALTWLEQKGKVKRVAPGTWALTEQSATSSDDITPAAGTAGVNGSGRGSHAIQVPDAYTGTGLPHSQ